LTKSNWVNSAVGNLRCFVFMATKWHKSVINSSNIEFINWDNREINFVDPWRWGSNLQALQIALRFWSFFEQKFQSKLFILDRKKPCLLSQKGFAIVGVGSRHRRENSRPLRPERSAPPTAGLHLID